MLSISTVYFKGSPLSKMLTLCTGTKTVSLYCIQRLIIDQSYFTCCGWFTFQSCRTCCADNLLYSDILSLSILTACKRGVIHLQQVIPAVQNKDLYCRYIWLIYDVHVRCLVGWSILYYLHAWFLKTENDFDRQTINGLGVLIDFSG